MKCAACQYESKPPETKQVPVLYARGPKKGEVKKVEEVTTTFPKFIRVEVQDGALPFTTARASPPYYYRDEPYRRLTLWACPQCGTIRMETDE